MVGNINRRFSRSAINYIWIGLVRGSWMWFSFISKWLSLGETVQLAWAGNPLMKSQLEEGKLRLTKRQTGLWSRPPSRLWSRLWFIPAADGVRQDSFRIFFRIISGFFQDYFRIFSELFQDYFRILSGSFRTISGFSQNYFRIFQDSFRIFSGSFRIFSELFQDLSGFSKEFFSRILLGLFQDFIRIF